MRRLIIEEFGNGEDPATEHRAGSWMNEVDPLRLSHSVILGGTGIAAPVYHVNGQEVSREEYEASVTAYKAAFTATYHEREFDAAEDAFLYAATLDEGVVLDWGRCYVAMDRAALKAGFVIDEWEQPVVTPQDLKVRPAPPYILGRRVGEGGCSTCFTDSSKSWSESEYEVIEDGNNIWPAGTRLRTHLVPDESARASVGRNWRMKLLRPEDVTAILPSDEQPASAGEGVG